MYSESGQYVLIGEANQQDTFESDIVQLQNHQVGLSLNFTSTIIKFL